MSFLICYLSKYIWVSNKQCRPRSDALIAVSDQSLSALFRHAYVSMYGKYSTYFNTLYRQYADLS